MKTYVSCCCPSLIPSRETARFYLLFVLIALYMLAGAAMFSSLERGAELEAHRLWDTRLSDFSHEYNISCENLKSLLRHYEEARAAGIRSKPGRALWDIPGAFYFVGTVLSTIGESGRIFYWKWSPLMFYLKYILVKKSVSVPRLFLPNIINILELFSSNYIHMWLKVFMNKHPVKKTSVSFKGI